MSDDETNSEVLIEFASSNSECFTVNGFLPREKGFVVCWDGFRTLGAREGMQALRLC